jgi:iron complex transport system permease protein
LEAEIHIARNSLSRTLRVCGILLITLLLGVTLAVLWGSERLPAGATLCALLTHRECRLTPEQQAILWQLRLPRIVLAGAVGGALAAAGAAYQALLRNPLAEPYLLGVSNGAAIGTMLALVFVGAHAGGRTACAMLGAMLATLAVYRLARGRSGATPERLILSGVIVTSLLSSLIVFATTLLDATRLRSFTFWLLGDLSGATPDALLFLLPATIVGVAVLTLQARPLNLLMLGERDAFDFGVEVGRVRLVVFIAASLLVGASVAAGGSVGYVGLVVPHLVRLKWGSDNRLALPAAALAGALFVIVADTLARTLIAPRELPVGALTALIGAPLFIYLLRRG